MQLQTHALYYLLRLNHDNDPSIACEPWQIEDLRVVSLDELWKRLTQYGVQLTAERLRQFAAECDSPEDLADLLLGEVEDSKSYDAAYLVIFELWRRLFPERQTLSIFGDELDHRISLYYAGELKNDEPIQDVLSSLKEILDENFDAGVKPAVVFKKVSSYCAHDLMAFIIDFISNLLDAQKERYAAELIDSFSPYAPSLIWFDFLRARLTALNDPIQANRHIHELLQFDRMLTLDLLLEILRFQVGYGEKQIFWESVKKTITRLQTQEDFREMLLLCADYFHRRDREDLEAVVREIIQRQNMGREFQSSDSELQEFETLILHSSRSGIG